MKKTTASLVAAACLLSFVPAAGAASEQPAPVPAAGPVLKHDYAQDRVLVKMKAGKDDKALAKKYGAQKVKDLKAWKVLKVPAGKAAEFKNKFAQDADVADVELDYVMRTAASYEPIGIWPDDDWCPTKPWPYPYPYPIPDPHPCPWYFELFELPFAWEKTIGSKYNTIAIFDTGVDLEHADLVNKLVPGYDFVDNDEFPMDLHGHGTEMAGIMAAETNNGMAAAGIDWEAMVMPLRVLDETGQGYSSNVIEAMQYAVDQGANVFNLSMTGGEYSDAFQEVISYVYDNGGLIVAAAGNDGMEEESFPAAYENVLSVGAVDQELQRAEFSNFGPWVDFAAPGVDMWSTTRMGGVVIDGKGTSYSAAVVSALASLTWSTDLEMSNEELTERLFNSTMEIDGVGDYYQYGIINALKAVSY